MSQGASGDKSAAILLVVPATGTLAAWLPGQGCSGQTRSSVLFLCVIRLIAKSLVCIFLCTWRQLEVLLLRIKDRDSGGSIRAASRRNCLSACLPSTGK